MRFTEILRLVWINIMENKFKMMLTSLGVIVGAATIVLVIAIGEGGQADVAEQFKNLNAGAIDISVGTGINMDAIMREGIPPGGMVMIREGNTTRTFGGPSSGSGGNSAFGGASGAMPSMGSIQRPGSTRLSMEDVNDIRTLVADLVEVTLLQSGEATVFGGTLEEEKTNVTVAGIYPEYQYVSNLTAMYGRFFEEGDEDGYYAVIGYGLAEEIFTYAAYAQGDYLEIDGKTYEIIGVLEKMGAVSSGISPDQAVYLPYAIAEKHVFGGTASPKIAAVAGSVDDVPYIMEDVEAVLSENHPNASFDVTDAGSAKEVASSSANTLALLLLAVASIVFIVGGIGIMNVMFVSVKERTSEIGILKAVGCSKKTILLEFLLEAAIISVIGGLVGVGAGFALMPLLELFGMRAESSVFGWVLALLFAIITGTVFGFYPAWKASRLVPIEALVAD